jgi:hypothetical protein
MSPSSDPKRLPADAYDHLWSLLPVYVVFLALVSFAAITMDESSVRDSRVMQVEQVESAQTPVQPVVPF